MNCHSTRLSLAAAIVVIASCANAAPRSERYTASWNAPMAQRVYPAVSVEAWRAENRTLPPNPTLADKTLFDRTIDTSEN